MFIIFGGGGKSSSSSMYSPFSIFFKMLIVIAERANKVDEDKCIPVIGAWSCIGAIISSTSGCGVVASTGDATLTAHEVCLCVEIAGTDNSKQCPRPFCKFNTPS